MKKKKVLHIVEAFGGGVLSFLEDISNEMSNDYDITIAYGVRKETTENFEKKFKNDIKFIKVENFTRSITAKKDIKALKEIKAIIKKEKPDIVHLHSSKAGVLGRIAIKGKRIKMFYNPHGFSFLKQDDSKIKRKMYWLIEKGMAILNPRCTIVGCSKGEYKEALKLSKNSICINNGINVEKLKKETTEIQPKVIDLENFKICTIGRIGYQKNPKLFNEIAQKFPNMQFTWIGDGDLINELTSPNIVITGWKERNEVLQILNESDVFILTSLWEGLPISLLEAMFMRKICIVSDVIGNRDVIKDGTNGFIAKDCDEFCKKITDIQNGKCDLNKISDNGFKDIQEIYNTDVMSREYIKIYKGLQ